MNQLPSRSTFSRSSGVSLHRQLFLSLRDQIMQGTYPPGAMIPNEEALCEQFGVSRITVRRAVADLEARRLLEKRHGRGTFVRADLPPSRPRATLGLVDSLRKTATETRAEVLSVDRNVPPAAIAEQLCLPPNVRAVHVMRLRWQGTMPVAVTEAWVTEAVGRRITVQALKKRALYEILIAQGVQFGRVVQEITAVVATPYYAELLKVEVGSPLLKLTRLLYDLNREPVQHLVVHVAPERSRILMDVSIDAVNTLAAGSIFHDVADHAPRDATRVRATTPESGRKLRAG